MKALDRSITLPARRGPKAARRGASRGGYCLRLMALTLAAVSINLYSSNASSKSNDPQELKLYAYNQMSWSQFECYNVLIYAESRWNPKAMNGSHYGLAQMRNSKVRYLNGFQQIDWHLRYLAHRYKGDACLSLKHFERFGWH